MEYFKKVGADFSFLLNGIQNQIPLKFENNYGTDITVPHDIVEEFARKFEGLVIANIILFSRPPGSVQSVHIDYNTNAALNIPVGNIGNGTMYWFGGTYTTEFKNLEEKHGRTWHLTWTDGPIEIDQTVIDKPTLVRTNVPHRVINDSSDDRLVLSVRWKGNPTFEEVCNKFSPTQ